MHPAGKARLLNEVQVDGPNALRVHCDMTAEDVYNESLANLLLR